jgi:hypothetical protein
MDSHKAFAKTQLRVRIRFTRAESKQPASVQFQIRGRQTFSRGASKQAAANKHLLV